MVGTAVQTGDGLKWPVQVDARYALALALRGQRDTSIRYDDNGGDPGSQLGLPSSQGTTEIGLKLLLPGANFREGY